MVKTIDRIIKLKESIHSQWAAIEYNQKVKYSSHTVEYDTGRVAAYHDIEERLTKLIGQLPGG
jgi:hypothetical protein